MPDRPVASIAGPYSLDENQPINPIRTIDQEANGMAAMRTGAQIIWEALVREGVTTVFGYPGGAILPAYDALLEYPVRHVLVRHEQGATHMADGYARASGQVGVAIATSGPGATNMVTGIATAMLDSSPVLCITGQVGSRLIGSDAFQETDVTGVTLPITKHNYLVSEVDEIAPTIYEALYVARSGRPGPVLIDITKDAQQASTELDWNPRDVKLPATGPTCGRPPPSTGAPPGSSTGPSGRSSSPAMACCSPAPWRRCTSWPSAPTSRSR